MAKTTLATIKSFIKKNEGNLYIKNLSNFDGMTDGIEQVKNPSFMRASKSDCKNSHGAQGAWFVGNSRDYFKDYLDGDYEGYEISNCCGSFIIARPLAGFGVK